jgi:hypothetical protein
MRFGKLHFGSIVIDSVTYTHDVVIDRGKVSKRKKKPSKQFRKQFGHTPVSIDEKLPWKCRRLIIGTGNYGSLPVMEEVKREAHRLRIELLIIPTDEAMDALAKEPGDTNAILHVTC